MNSVMKIRESYTTDRAAAKFVDVIGKVIRESLKADLEKVRQYSVLNDGSTDVSVIEQKMHAICFVPKDGTSVIN